MAHKAFTPSCAYCDRGVAWNVRGENRLAIASRRRARALALVALVLVVCACSGAIDAPAAGGGGAAGSSGELAGVAGVGGQVSPVSMGDAGAGGQGGASSSSVAPCCALVDPAVMPAAAYACWCVELEPSQCSQAYWDAAYHATEEAPAPAWLPSGRCPQPEPFDGQVWCCARHATDWRYPEQKDACSCYLYTPDVCQGMLDSLGEAAGAVRVDQCP